MSIDVQDVLAQRLMRLYTGAVSDVLDGLGYRNQALPSSIVALTRGMRLAGPAFTIRGVSNESVDYDGSLRAILAMLGEVPGQHIAVYQANDSGAAHLGELSVTALKAAGCAGVLLDGGIRDVDLILAQEIPVFCRYATPKDGPGRWEVTDWGGTVSIGDTNISTGDYIFADSDGALAIPAGLVVDVLDQAEGVAMTEDRVRVAVAAGMSPLDAYDQFGRF